MLLTCKSSWPIPASVILSFCSSGQHVTVCQPRTAENVKKAPGSLRLLSPHITLSDFFEKILLFCENFISELFESVAVNVKDIVICVSHVTGYTFERLTIYVPPEENINVVWVGKRLYL